MDPASITMTALTRASAGSKAYGESQALRYAAAVAEPAALAAGLMRSPAWRKWAMGG